MPENVEEELEVVRAIYGDEEVQLLTDTSADEVRIEVDLRPRVEQGAALVSVTIAVVLPDGYPASALPKVHVERSRGLGDSALGTLMSAAQRACDEHGLQEDGCICQVLDAVSEALDEANDSQVECSICKESCSPGENVVHPPCDHIFHASCIGHWAALKAEEAEAKALEAAASIISARDGLRREVEESVNREAEAALRASDARKYAATCAKLPEIVRLRREGGERAESLVVDAEHEAMLVNEEEEEIPLERLVEQARSAKAEEKRLIAEERRAQARLADEQRRLEVLEAELEQEAQTRAAAPMPCPVCRKPIERSLLPEPICRKAPRREEKSIEQGSVAALPENLRKQVYSVQAHQRALLNTRSNRESANEAQTEATVELSNAVRTEAKAQSTKSPQEQAKGYGKSVTQTRSEITSTQVEQVPSWSASNWDSSEWSTSAWWAESGNQGAEWWNKNSTGSSYQSGGKGGERRGRWR
mmetsp:Transcript_120310/g.190596  ORF Transcript_120310/g.190596 Transcript_120310/m.190596 type:complete len:476 (+) Transcript_120310:62-1489(+)